uniref:Spermatosis associated 7 n=1 Tax=Sarcophilus harrisii TaxID=9305 RepID=A0A7N4P3F8_SARHA
MPRYDPSSPFTGHLSIKSNAFCTDSSSLRLSTLYLIKNHMAVHYNKILSAKAVVDCSMPVSMTSSIKYSDQQRREKLKKEMAQCEKDSKLSRSSTQTSNKSSPSPISSMGLKTSSCNTYGMKEKIIPSQHLRNNLAWEKVKENVLHYPFSRASIPYYLQPSPVKKIQSEEEELLYLSFIEDVTDEILKLGLFSNRVLERLFERHIEQNKHHLEEKKMRHMLHVLKVDLGCTPEGKPEKLNGTLNMSNLFDFEKLETPEEIQLTDENEIPVSPSKSEETLQSLDVHDKALDVDLTQKEIVSASPSCTSLHSSKDKYSEDSVNGQVISETNLEPSAETEEPSVSYPTSNPVFPTEFFEEGNNDLEKTESLNVSGKTHLEECVQNSIKEDNDHDTEEPTSNITETINEQNPLDN